MSQVHWHRGIFIVVFIVSGCTPNYVWVKNGATQADFERDKSQCIYEAASATANYNTGPTLRGIGSAAGQGFGEGIAIGLRRNKLVLLCLQAKGYSKQPIQEQNNADENRNKIIEKDTNLDKGVDVDRSGLECSTDLDCLLDESCRSKKGGGTECRKIQQNQ